MADFKHNIFVSMPFEGSLLTAKDDIDIEKQRDDAHRAQHAAVVCMQDNYVHHISNMEN